MSNPQTAVFPFAASTDTILLVASDEAQTALNGDIGNSDTTINVVDNSQFDVPCVIVIDGEVIRAKGKGTNTFTNCDRGFAGTTATTHTDTTPVFGYDVAYLHNQMAAEVNSISSLVFTSDFSGLKKNENLLLWSEAFENVAWSLASGATISGTTGTSPVGDATARTLLEGNSLGTNSVSASFSPLNTGATYTFSVYAQYTNNQWLSIGQNVANDTTRRVSFDIQNGVIGTQGSAAQGAIVSVGGGWYRCLVVTNCTSSPNNTFDIVLENSDDVVSYLGTDTQSVMIWGAQVRTGGFDGPLSYIKTSGATVSITGGGDLILDEGDLT